MSPLYARKTSATFDPAPIGPQHAICCDVVDLGMVHSEKYDKTQHKCELRWQSENIIEKSGKPYLIIKRYTLSMHEKARLRVDIESWLGRTLTDEEASEFDVESLLDKVALISIVHNRVGDKVYGNVSALMPPMKGAPAMKVRDYDRVCARDGYKAPEYASIPQGADEPPPHTDADMGAPDDDIPF